MLFLHTAKQGEDLNTIAKMFKTTPDDIRRLNGLTDSRIEGRRLLIHSMMEMPEWMSLETLWFDDLTCRQLSGLMYNMCSAEKNDDDIMFMPAKMTPVETERKMNVTPETVPQAAQEARDGDAGRYDAVVPGPPILLAEPRDTEIKTQPEMIADPEINREPPALKRADAAPPKEPVKPEKRTYERMGTTHTVKDGETLASLAAQYGLTTRILQKAGGAGANPKIGAEVNIPTVQGRRYFYTVRLGDTPDKVAGKFGLSREKLMQINYIDESENLLPGTQLLILI